MRMDTSTKRFYRKALLVALPIMAQNAVTNFVSMLDNIMVGRVGTDSMSGVAIDNQLLFVFNLCIFGGLAGIGIFTAQYYGKGDEEGVRQTFRLQLFTALILTTVGLLIFMTKGGALIDLYLKGESGTVDAAATRGFALAYMAVMYFELLPFAITQVYSTTLRATGETLIPMQATLAAVVVNLAGNYILIYGKFGAPALGAVGAAVATVLSRIVEMLYIIIRTHRRTDRFPFMRGVYTHLFSIPRALIKQAVLKGTPLLVNEALWAGGMAVMNQVYSIRGLDVVAATNISSTISNVFNVAFIAMGNAISIIIGQELGAGKLKTVKRDAWRLTGLSCFLCVLFGAALFCVSGLYPQIYNTSPEIRHIATGLIRVAAICMPMYSFENAAYFVIRSGGKTMITFLFDSCFMWVACIPATYCLIHFTGLSIVPLYAAVQAIDLIKCLIGAILVHKGIWIHDLTKDTV